MPSTAGKFTLRRFVPQSLKARLTLFALTIVIVGILALVHFVKTLLRDELLRFTGEQQRSALAVLASQVNHGLQERTATLTTVASRIKPQDLANPMAGQAFLLERPFLAEIFNGGMVLWRLDGQRLTDLQHKGQSAVNQPLDAQELSLVLGQGQPLVGRVHRDQRLQVGVFAIAVPVRNAQGQVMGALGGTIRLDHTNFLSELLNHKYGRTGNFFLIDARDRIIFASSDATRLMETLPGPGKHAMVDKFVAGFEGTTLAVNPHGQEVLVSVKQIALAQWYASVTLPPDEVFALITAIQPRSRLAYLGLLCLIIVAISWLVHHQLAPITDAVRTMAGFVHQHQTPQALPVARADEVGELVGGFNQLLGILTQQQQVLQNSELFKQAVLNSVTAEIAVLDAQGVIVAVNEAWQREYCGGPVLTDNASNGMTVGCSFLAACQSTAGSARSDRGLGSDEGIGAVLAGQLPRFYLEYSRHTPAQQRWCSMSVTPMAQGKLRGAVVSLEDITDRVLAQNQVRELAFYDPLTGLPNRRLVTERLVQDLSRARRCKTRLALLFIDLDHFKPVNDTLGHEVGDWLLQAVAQRIQLCLRASDTAGRLGGDEFVALLPDLSSIDAAMGVAEKIRQALAQEFLTEQGVVLQISASIGVAVFPDHAQTEKDLLHVGDEAMYRAKKGGRNAVTLCTALAQLPPPA
ncbi:MAG: diguanylate cyclase [Comamonadaceae bacterium]|nr:diguanylate cyclase [Comamonadaceae bacterium]